MSYILFGNKNTQTDYGLIVAPYEIPMPTAQTNFVPVPGRDGSLDLTEAFDAIRFNDRIILLTLYATGEYDARVSAFVNAVHGKRMQIVFSKDTNYYYTGRVDVTSISKRDGYCEIAVTITAEPFKMDKQETAVTVTGNGTAILRNTRMPVVPFVSNTEQATLTFTASGNTVRLQMSPGGHLNGQMYLPGDETRSVTVESTGTTIFTFRKGRLADVNDGDPHLIDSANAAIYGTIYAPMSLTTWDTIKTPTNLLQKGLTWLASSGARLKETISLTAVDLHSLDADVECFQFLDRVIVTCGDICPQAEFVLTKMTIPLQDPANMRITLGDSRISLVAENTGKIADAVDRIESIEADYVTNSEATEIVQHEITNNTSILQSAQQILLSALEDYVTTSDFNALQSSIETTLSVMAGTIEANFIETTSDISTLNGDVSQQFEVIRGFIRMIASGIVIGKSTSQIKLKLENDILYFFTGDEDSVSTENAIAYFSSGKLYVNTVQILTGMRIGPFAWMPESDNLNFKLLE